MFRLTQVGSTIVCLQLFMLGSAGFGYAQQSSPPSEGHADETPGSPGFEVIPPSQGDAISILPLDDMPSKKEEEKPVIAPEDEEGQNAGDSAEVEAITPPPFMQEKGASSVGEQGQQPLSYREVTIRALEKVTARTQDIVIPIGGTVKFHSLNITLRTCNKRPPEETPETTAFLEITENKPDGEIVKYFTGWMFASSPGLNGLEHPVYDVWVIDCKISEPVESSGIE